MKLELLQHSHGAAWGCRCSLRGCPGRLDARGAAWYVLMTEYYRRLLNGEGRVAIGVRSSCRCSPILCAGIPATGWRSSQSVIGSHWASNLPRSQTLPIDASLCGVTEQL